jgi:hypothetical protein
MARLRHQKKEVKTEKSEQLATFHFLLDVKCVTNRENYWGNHHLPSSLGC